MRQPKGLPIIRFVKEFRHIFLEYNGIIIGEFLQSQQYHKEAEQAKYELENLKIIFNDEMVDLFKYLEQPKI